MFWSQFLAHDQFEPIVESSLIAHCSLHLKSQITASLFLFRDFYYLSFSNNNDFITYMLKIILEPFSQSQINSFYNA